jgi:Kef-type K+ transport system membrane component KefB
VFLVAAYFGGLVFAPLYASLVGEIIAGAILGPHCANAIPEVEAVRLIGEVGLCLLVFEGGLSVDTKRIRSIGKSAFLIAVTGTLLPVLLGWGLMLALGYGTMEGLAAGTALSSTSIGMATRMMQDNAFLDTPLGSLITVAAMVDDVLSLIILAILGSLKGDGASLWLFARPIVASIG